MIRRHFVAVGDRRVHYRRAGAGPPLLMIHGSPGNSVMLEADMAAWADRYDCIAPDTPGFGLSDPLDLEDIGVADLADALAETIAALGLPPTRVFGTHTGAAIALELGARHPERVAGLVLDGVPIFDAGELATLFDGYFAPLTPDPLGGHLTTTWMRFRDQFTWFPWTARDPRRMNPIDRPSPADIEAWVTMFYATARYAAPYRAAVFYRQGAIRAAAALTRPAVFAASPEDMLFPHLDRLPTLRANQRILRLPHDAAGRRTALDAALAALPGDGRAPPPGPPLAGRDPALGFVATPAGDVFVRAWGDPAAPPLMLLHDAPGSGGDLAPLAKALAGRVRVIVPDLPGAGESAAAVDAEAPIEGAAVALSAVADALPLSRFALFGRGCGASVAARLAATDPRVTATHLDGLPLPDPGLAARLAPPLPLDPDGAHWLRAWTMLRDGEIRWPWYDGRYAARRTAQGDFDAARLHARTVALMKARTVYHHLIVDAFGRDPRPDLAAARAPVTIGSSPRHPLAGNDAAVPAHAAPPLPDDPADQADRLIAALAAAPL